MLKKHAVLFLFAAIGCKTWAASLLDGAAAVAPHQLLSETNQTQITPVFQDKEQVRSLCIEGRRLICGKILAVLPGGLVVDSGYTNLLREPLTQSWLVPKTVEAVRAKNLLEEQRPGATCIGLVFLTDFPKGKKFKPAQYDYVIIEAYPAGQFTYHSTGAIVRTIRRFSAGLDTAIQLNLGSKKPPPPGGAGDK